MELILFVVLIGILPAYVAQRKGRSFVVWWIYGSLLFVVALPHALIMAPLPDSDEALNKAALRQKSASALNLDSGTIDFIADGVIKGTPFRVQPDGGVIALFGNRVVKFKSMNDLTEVMAQSPDQSN